MICCPKILASWLLNCRDLNFHFTLDICLQGHTLDVVVIWDCLFQKSKNSNILIPTLCTLRSCGDPHFLGCLDFLLVYQHLFSWPLSFSYTVCVSFLAIRTVLPPMPLGPLMLLLPPPTTKTPISRSVVTVCIVYY